MKQKLFYAKKALNAAHKANTTKNKNKTTNALEQLKQSGWPPKLPSLSPELEKQVFTHKSACNEPTKLDSELLQYHNQRLEFLGDSIIHYTATKLLYEKFPTSDIHQLESLRQTLVCNQTLGEFGHVYNLIKKLKHKSQITNLISAQTMEAYIGAAYLHNGFHPIQTWFEKLAQPLIKQLQDAKDEESPINRNAKTELYGLLKFAPQYNIVKLGSDGQDLFEVDCCIRGSVVSTGTGHSISEAGLRAAMAALENPDVLRLVNN